MAVTVAVLCLFGAYLTVVSVAGADPNDPGLVQVALFGSPFLAAAAAFVTGLMLTILGALRLVELTLARALVALVLGLVGSLSLDNISVLSNQCYNSDWMGLRYS